MRIAVCDDEKSFTGELAPMIYEYGKQHRLEIVVDTFTGGEDLLRSEKIYDIIYLDYQMDGLNGMDTARQLRAKNLNCTIVFVTSYPDFVYESFEVDAFRFLKKPVEESMIAATLDAYFKKQGNDYPILLTFDRETVAIETKDIVFLEARGKHCAIHTKTKLLECAKTMASVAKLLPRSHFFKINKAFVVNFDCIDRYSKDEIVFKNGEKAYISRNYGTAFKVAYRKYSMLKNPL